MSKHYQTLPGTGFAPVVSDTNSACIRNDGFGSLRWKNAHQLALPEAILLIKICRFKTSEFVRPSSAAGLREFHNDTGWNGKYSQTMQLWEFPPSSPVVFVHSILKTSSNHGTACRVEADAYLRVPSSDWPPPSYTSLAALISANGRAKRAERTICCTR